MLGVPATTDFDLNFRLLGIPVRINPFFWVLAALLGWASRSASEVLVWVACVLVSILFHEFGHGLTARALDRQKPSIVLYGMGGLCFYDREHSTAWRRLAIILMGPGAGLLLFVLTALAGSVVLGITPFMLLGITPVGPLLHQPPAWAHSPLVLETYRDLVVINLIWSLFNLLPIYPLDGGQLTHTVFSMFNRYEGPKRCYIVSMGVAALLAVYLYQRDESINAFIVAYLGLINFQFFQAARFQTRYSDGFEEDDNWWRK